MDVGVWAIVAQACAWLLVPMVISLRMIARSRREAREERLADAVVEPTWNLYPAADPSEVAPADRSWLRTESIGPRWRMRVSGPLAPPAADKPIVPRPVVAYRCLEDGQKCGCEWLVDCRSPFPFPHQIRRCPTHLTEDQ